MIDNAICHQCQQPAPRARMARTVAGELICPTCTERETPTPEEAASELFSWMRHEIPHSKELLAGLKRFAREQREAGRLEAEDALFELGTHVGAKKFFDAGFEKGTQHGRREEREAAATRAYVYVDGHTDFTPSDVMAAVLAADDQEGE